MADLSINYMGLKLRNPLIVSSSGLTSNVEKIKKIEENGAAAVVLKSLFEEQINYETSDLLKHNEYPEAADYLLTYVKDNSISEYLSLIEQSKKAVSIPIIASVNCVSDIEWTDFAMQMEEAGADALELNIHIISSDKNMNSEKIEQKYINIIQTVVQKIKIPVAVKIGRNFSNLANFVSKLEAAGTKAVVFFNRFYETDIDINTMNFTAANIFSTPEDLRQSLRWVGLLAANENQIEISASTGIHTSEEAIKMLLAGATSFQVCSTLYKYGFKQIEEILTDLSEWMQNKGFRNIAEFRGKMSYAKVENPSIYERSQFMKYFSSVE